MSEAKETVTCAGGNGAIHISEDVISSIAALAASETEGVAALSGGSGVDFSELLGKKNLSRGVKIGVDNDTVSADIFLTIKYGIPLITVSAEVQNNVKTAIESMTGLKVTLVNVHVLGVAFDKKHKEK